MAHTSVRWSGVQGMSYHFISSGVTISAVDVDVDAVDDPLSLFRNKPSPWKFKLDPSPHYM